MNLLISARTLGHGLVLSTSLFLLQANPVMAAEAVGDAQTQARELLSGTVGGRANNVEPSPATPAGGRYAFNPDPQQQARQLILGKPNFAGIADRAVGFDSKTKATTVASVRSNRRTYPDGQESARRMLLGAGG